MAPVPIDFQAPYATEALLLWAVVAVGAFVGKLVVGTLLLALVPDGVENVLDTVESETGSSARLGLGIFAVVAASSLLVVALFGVVATLQFVVVALVVYVFGGTIVFIAIGERLLDAFDVTTSRWGHLLAGTLVATTLAMIPVVGIVVNLVGDHVGLGAILYRWRG